MPVVHTKKIAILFADVSKSYATILISWKTHCYLIILMEEKLKKAIPGVL